MILKKLTSIFDAGSSWADVSAWPGKLKQAFGSGLVWANATVPVRFLKQLLGAGRVWAAFSIIVTLGLHSLGLFDLLNYKVLDFTYTRVRGPLAGWSARQPIDRDSLKVVLVDVDDESWRLVPFKWPYPRDDVWAKVIRNLTAAGAKVIVFDIEFDTPDFKSDYLEKLNQSGSNIPFRHGDEVLGEAIREAQARGTRVVMASKLVYEPTRLPPEYIAYPVPRIMAAQPEPGLVNEIKDFDGITRKYALAYNMAHKPDTLYMTLALKALKEYWGISDTTLLRPDPENNAMTYGRAMIKTYGRSASFFINYYGPPSGTAMEGEEAWKTFDRYPLANILDDAEFDLRQLEDDTDWMDFFKLDSDIYGIVGESPFLDKIVLIGVSVNVLLDVKSTPYYNYAGILQLMPGVEVHANAVQTILDQNFIRVAGGTLELTRDSLLVNLMIIILLSTATFLLVQRLSPLTGGFLAFVELLVFVNVALGYFTSDLLWMPKMVAGMLLPKAWVLANPVLFTIGTPAIGASMFVPIIPGAVSIFVTYGSIVLYRFLVERKDKQFLKNTFGTYISPELIDEMYASKQMPSLGGESGILTAYFTDIASFSAFSEVLTATRLVELLNEYLTAMTDVLLEQQGTLDKYEGDAIVAFFGAPIYFEDHAHRACVVALQMQEALAMLREKWQGEEGKWPELVSKMRMRIGLNTGELVTGNMGSRTRMNYTMMGDVVNTAARLEASAKQYGIYIQTTMPTLDLAGKDKFEWRFIDKVKVVGKQESVDAVEIMALKGQLADDMLELNNIFNAGMELYRQQDWDGGSKKFTASEKLEEVFHNRPTTPSRVYVERCAHFKANPPGSDWDGSWTLTAK